MRSEDRKSERRRDLPNGRPGSGEEQEPRNISPLYIPFAPAAEKFPAFAITGPEICSKNRF